MQGLDVSAGDRLIAFATIDSTNDELKRRAAAGATDGTVVWAETQTHGRGRGLRVWQSPPGNLYASILVRPDCAAADGAQLTFAAALATADAVAAHVAEGADVRCKWPNDVLIAGRKVAGILLESALAPSGRLEWLIVGVGINVAWHPPDDAALLYPATSLRAHGAAAPRPEDVLAHLVAAFAHWRAVWAAEGFPPLRAAWLARAYGLARAVTVRLDGETVAGVFADLDAGGALVVETACGVRRSIVAGDVFPAGA